MQIILKNAELKLMDSISMVHQPEGWNAIHFHLGKLMEEYKSDYQFNIAINLIHDLLKSYEGDIFLLSDHSIIVLCYGLPQEVHNKIIFQLRYLYANDPLAYTETGNENPAFCTSYVLKNSWKEFWDLCSQRLAASQKKVKSTPPDEAAEVAKGGESGKKSSLNASALANIERDLRYADLNRAVRRQAICTVQPGVPMRNVFEELYINITHLRQVLRTDVDFLSNRWLFKYFTQSLDQRMLEFLRTHPRFLEKPISINLNAETLLSPWFAEFDAMLKAETKVAIVIEVPAIDIFANMELFMRAKAQVQKQGYRVCLDGLTAMSFTQINREKLGVDILKLQWNADSHNDLNNQQNKDLAAAVANCGTNRVILCRCDDLSAIEYGQELGISLFQGRHIDNVLNPDSKIKN